MKGCGEMEKKQLNIKLEGSKDHNGAAELIGALIGGCSTCVVYTVLRPMIPESVNMAAKVVYGIGAFGIGTIVGNQVSDAIEEQVLDSAKPLIVAKAAIQRMKRGDEKIDVNLDDMTVESEA